MSLIEDIQALQSAIGPKRIKTTDIEVEQFDLRELVQAAQKGGEPPLFSQFKFTKAIPKYGHYCEENQEPHNHNH